MKTYFKRFLAVFLSLMIVISSTQSAYAASPSGWSVQSVSMQGSTAVVSAAKQGFKSVANYAPTAGAVGKEVLKVGAGLAVIYAVNELLGYGIDWVMNSAGDVVYTVPPTADQSVPYLYQCNYNGCSTTTFFSSKDALQNRYFADTNMSGGVFEYTGEHVPGSSTISVWYKIGGAYYNVGNSITNPSYDPAPKEQTLPLSAIASKVISNAAAGHSSSQDIVKAAAITSVNAGTLDADLEENAVPSDSPYDPTNPDAPAFDPSSIIAALQSVMSAITNMSASLKQSILTMSTVLSDKIDEMIGKQTETNQVINDGMADVVAANNATGVRVGDVVAAIEALEGNMLDGQVINDAIDRAIAAGNTNTSDIVSAIEAIEGNTLDGQVINDAIDRVIANDNANAQAASDAASQAASDAAAADVANTTAVTDSIDAAAAEAKEAADAKAAADAAALDWAKEEPLPPTDTGVIVDEPITDFDTDKSYITFTGSCPPKYTASLGIMGVTAPFEFDYTPICTVMSYLKPFIVGAGYIAAAYIIAGHSRGSKD